MTTWKILISEAFEGNDSWESVIRCTASEAELNIEFDNGYGGARGIPFTLWTHDRVYFPVCYDGAEWVGSAPRNPCGIAMEHIGGG